MKEYKIYFLIDPFTDEVRYVGQTSTSLNRRLYQHIRDVRKSPKRDWISKIIECGSSPIIEMVDIVNEQSICNDLEIKWIGHIRNLGYRLLNLTDGGNVTTGYKFTEEQKNKMRGRIPWNKDRKMTDIERYKISKSLERYNRLNGNTFYGKKHSDISKMKISKGNSKEVYQFDMDGNFIRKWKSCLEVEKVIGLYVSRVCKGYRKTAGGYMWSYKKNITK